jgi:hypothetical protein
MNEIESVPRLATSLSWVDGSGWEGVNYGEFCWLGQLHHGLHQPLISHGLYGRVQRVFAAANHPRHTKRRHAFAGLVACGRCGCAFTAETKKGQYVRSTGAGQYGARSCGRLGAAYRICMLPPCSFCEPDS